MRYRGRFAPSPSGALHAGSLVAALASWLDARAHQGQWLVRIEDVDTSRCRNGIDEIILAQLAACGLSSDEPVTYQSDRFPSYQRALERLIERRLAYPCACSRTDIEVELALRGQGKPRHGELVYPGTCRQGLHERAARAWRVRTDTREASDAPGQAEQNLSQHALDDAPDAHRSIPRRMDRDGALPAADPGLIRWWDRRLGHQQQDVEAEVGDFVLKRADGCFAYQLAVVVDDAAQGITDVVRGEDLCDNTPRQILLQRHLDLPCLRYLHTPLVRGVNGEKLSKQNGAAALDTSTPQGARTALQSAASSLGLVDATPLASDALATWVRQWQTIYPPA